MTRAFVNVIFEHATRIVMVLCAGILTFLILVIVWNGAGAINVDFLTAPASEFGSAGGVAYQIIGSVLLVLVAAALSMPIAVGTAIFLSEYIRNDYATRAGLTFLFSLNGVPSISFGIFGLIFFVYFLETGISWFVGSIILAMMMLPAITLSAFQSINSIPSAYRENAYALGFQRWQVVTSVLAPQGLHGAVTGLLIALGRAIGETAPIMFIATAFSGVSVPQSLNEPVSTLPTHILALAQQATNPQALQNAWGASLILIGLVFLFSFSALFLRLRIRGVSAR